MNYQKRMVGSRPKMGPPPCLLKSLAALLLSTLQAVSAQVAWANETCVIPDYLASSACGVSSYTVGPEVQINLKLQREGAVCTACDDTASLASITATLGGISFNAATSGCNNGLCFLFFSDVQTAGDLTLSVQLSGAAISGSPYTVTLATADDGLQLGSTSVLGGAGLTGGPVNSSISFTIRLQDQYSNALSTTAFSCSIFDVSVSYQGSAGSPSAISPSCSFVEGATFLFTYSSTLSGSWLIFLQTTDPVNYLFTVTQSAVLTPLGVSVSESSIRVVGTAPLAGQDGALEIISRDAFSNQLTSSGATWALSVRSFSASDGGPNQTQITGGSFSYQSSGLYSASFSATRAGQYTLSVSASGLSGALTTAVAVDANRFYAPNMNITGMLEDLQAGSVMSYSVRGIDEYGNAHLSGSVSLSAQVRANQSSASSEVASVSVTPGTDGSSSFSFTVTRSGFYALFVELTGSGEYIGGATSVGGSPFVVAVTAEEAAALSGLSFSVSLESAIAGTVSSTEVQEVDEYGNLRTVSLESFTVILQGPYSSLANVSDIGQGKYRVSYAPTISGSYSVQISTAATTFTASDFQVDVAAGSPAAVATLREDYQNYQGGETLGSVNATNYFAVKSVDRFGNRISVGGYVGNFVVALQYCTDPLAACVGEPSKQSGALSTAQIADIGNGYYGVEYLSTVAGYFAASVLYDGVHIFGSPWDINVGAGLTDSAASYAFGLGQSTCHDVVILPSVSEVMLCSIASDTTSSTFDVRLVDVFGNERQTYSAQDAVIFSVKSGLVFYNPTSEQNTSLSIVSDVISQQFDDGLHLITFPATISAFYSATIQHGEVTNCNPSCAEGNIRNLEDIANTPASVFVKPASAHAPFSFGEGSGLSVGTAGVTSSFFIFSRDVFKNDRFGVVSAVGLNGWTLAMSGPGGHQVTGAILGQSDGKFNATFYVTIAGEYTMTVELNGEALASGLSSAGSPYAVTVFPSPASAASYIVGTSPFGGQVAVTPATVRLQAVDEYGNERTVGLDNFQAAVQDLPNSKILQIDNGDGTYDVQFYITVAGTFQSQISIGGVQLSGSPFEIDMRSGVMVPKNSEVFPSSVGTAGIQIKWTLTARDIFHNVRDEGSDDFKLECSNQRDGGPGVFEDFGNGTYTGICLLTRSGSYQVSVQGYNSNSSDYRDVISSPFSLEIEPNVADPSSSGVYGNQLSLATAGDWATFYIFPRDRFLNPNTGTGGANFELVMRRVLPNNDTVLVGGCPYQVPSLEWGAVTQPPDGISIGATSNGTCASVDGGNGTSTISYMVTVAGVYRMLVNIVTPQGLTPTSEGEFRMDLKPSVTDTAASFAFGSALRTGTVGEDMTFLIQTRDRFENVRTSMGGLFNVSVTGLGVLANGLTSVTDLEDGTHLATYSATLSAKYSLLVFYDSISLGNSPVNATLFPARSDPSQFLVAGPGLASGEVDEEYWIAVSSKDRFGNVKTRGGTAVRLTLSGGWTEAADGTQQAAASVLGITDDLADGRYNLTYRVTRSGVYKISVESQELVEDGYLHAVSSPFAAAFGTGGISAVETTAFELFDSAALILANENQNVATAGKSDGFFILAKDRFGNPRTAGGRVNEFDVFMEWESPLDGIDMLPEGRPNSTCTVAYLGTDSGQYRATYSATVSGVYVVSISFAGEAVTGHRVQVYPSRIDPGMCVASFPTVDDHGDVRYRYTTAGSPSTFAVLARDLFNNPVFTGGERFFVNVSAFSESEPNGDVAFSGLTQQEPSSQSALCDSAACIVDNDDGTYTVSITPTISGRYLVAVFLESDPICQSRCSDPLNSPYEFTTVATSVFGALSLAYGSGLRGGQAGFDLTFQIQARDQFGNNRTHGRWNGVDGFGGEFFRSAVRVNGPLLNAALCVCNSGICFNCEAIDCGSALADNRCAVLSAPYPVVADLKDGTYDVKYSLTQAAEYTIAIIANDGLHLLRSPFSATIDPGKTDPASCTTVGDGLYRAVAGEVAYGRVQAQDAFGNYRRSGGDDIKIVAQHTEGRTCARDFPDGPCLTCSVDDEDCAFLGIAVGETKPLSVRGNLTDFDTGAYEIAYIATVAGFYQLRLKINGTSLGTNTPFRSPFPLQVIPNILDPTSSTVDGEGVSLATVFKTSYFNLWPRDRYGNSLAAAKDPIYVQLCTSNQKSDCVQRAGFAYVKLSFFNFDNRLVYPVKEKYSRASIDPGQNTGTPIEAEVRPNRDGSTTVSYAMEELGTYRVSVDVLDDKVDADFVAIRGSPFNLSVYPEDPVPFPVQCDVAEGSSIVAGTVGRTVVTLRNQYGITLVDSARKDMIFIAPIQGNPSEFEITVSDRRDGTFDLNFQPTTAGQYFLAVTAVDANGIFDAVKGSPYQVEVVPAETDPKSCIAFVSQDTIATAGVPFSFFIQTRDEFGNDQSIDTEGPEDAYDAVLTRIASSDAPLKAIITRVTPRETRFIATFSDELGIAQTTVSGQYELSVNNRGIDVLNSPHVLPVEPGPIDGGRSVVDPSAISVTTAGTVSIVRVQARDSFDNRKTDEQGSAFILVKNETASPTGFFEYSTAYVLDGVTEVSFENRIAGSYVLHVLLAGQDVLNSPFSTVVIPGRASAPNSYNKTVVPSSGLAGTVFAFVIQAADEFGNDHTAGGEKFDVTLKGNVYLRTYVRNVLCIDIQEAFTCIEVIDEQNGEYSVSFTPSNTGDYFLEATLLSLDGLWRPIGQPGTRSASPWRQCVPCLSNFQGRTCERCRTLIVLPNVVAIEASTVTGTGAVRFVSGIDSSFIFYSRDLYGNLLSTGGLDLSVRILQSTSLTVLNTTITDLCPVDIEKCGQYTVQYMSTAAGSYAVSISLLGMRRSMPSILGLPALAADPVASGLPWLPNTDPSCEEFGCVGAKCCLSGEGSSFAITGEETTFLIQARDKYGNAMTSGGASFTVEITGPTFTVGTVEDLGIGQYIAKFKALVAGEYSLSVRLRGIHIGLMYDSCPEPTVQCFESSPSPLLQVTDPGTGLEGLVISGMPFTLEAGVSATINVDAADLTAQRKLSQNALQAVLTPSTVSEASELNLEVLVLNDGEDYAIPVSSTVATTWELWLTSGNFIHLVGSPFTVEVSAAELSIANTIVTDTSQRTGLSNIPAQLGIDVTIFVITRDEYQNSRQYLSVNDIVRWKLWHQGEAEPLVETLSVRAAGDFEGQYMIPYKPDLIGLHNIRISIGATRTLVDSNLVPPLQVRSIAGSVVQSETVAYGRGLQIGTAGVDLTFTIEARDNNGVTVRSGSTPFAVQLSENSETQVTFLLPQSDGTYLFNDVVTKAGTYRVMVSLDQNWINALTLGEVLIVPGDAHPAATQAVSGLFWMFGEGLQDAATAEQVEFQIQLFDRFGNSISEGLPLTELTIAIDGDIPTIARVEERYCTTPNVEFSNCGSAWHDLDGTYRVLYAATKAGQYRVSIDLQGQSIDGSPWQRVVSPGVADVTSSIVGGAGLFGSTAGVPAILAVTARDVFGNPVEADANVNITLRGPSFASASIVAVSLAEYEATYAITRSGAYVMDIRINSNPVPNSPFPLQIAPSDTDYRTCEAHGDGLSRVVAGTVASFNIIARDGYGNMRTAGGDLFRISLSGPTVSTANVQDFNNGTYQAQFQLDLAGDYVLVAAVGFDQFLYIPRLVCLPAAVNGLATQLVRRIPSELVAGTEVSFDAQARDRFGSKILSCDFTVEVDIQSAFTESGRTISYYGNETWQCEAGVVKGRIPSNVLTQTGQYQVSVLIGAQHIFDSPFTSEVRAAIADPGQSFGFGATETIAGVQQTFWIESRDAFGNMVMSNPFVEAEEYQTLLQISGFGCNDDGSPAEPGALCALATVTDLRNSTFAASFTLSKSGRYEVVARLQVGNGLALIRNTPATLWVLPAALEPTRSVATGYPRNVTAETFTSFLMYSRDKFDNIVVDSLGKFEAFAVRRGEETGVLESLSYGATVVYKQQGAYEVGFFLTTAAAYRVVLLADGLELLNSPFSLDILPGELVVSESTLSGGGADGGITGFPATFTIHARDSNGNQLWHGGAPWRIKVFTPSDLAQASDQPSLQPVHVDNDDGTYSVTYTSIETGRHLMLVEGFVGLERVTVRGGVRDYVFFVVDDGYSVPGRSIAYGSGTYGGVVGETISLTVQIRNELGLNRPASGLILSAGLALLADTSSTLEQLTPVDNNDGTYTVTYTSRLAGEYELTLKLSGDHILGSPFVVNIIPGTTMVDSTTFTMQETSSVVAAPVTFRIQARDEFWNMQRGDVFRGSDPFSAKFVAQGAQDDFEARIYDNEDGTYTGIYATTVAGVYKLMILLSSMQVGPSIDISISPGATMNENCVVSGSGVSALLAGQSGMVYILARDLYGNLVQHGREIFNVTMLSAGGGLTSLGNARHCDSNCFTVGNCPCPEIDLGVYALTYSVQNVGEYLVSVRRENGLLPGSPSTVVVSESFVSTRKTTVNGCEDECRSQIATCTDVQGNCGCACSILTPMLSGSQFSLVVQSRDNFRNKVFEGRKAFVVSMYKATPPGRTGCFASEGCEPARVQGQVEDNLDGTYTIILAPAVPGAYVLDIVRSGEHVEGSPFLVEVVPGTASAAPDGSRFSLTPVATAGVEVSFTVQARDIFGNQLTSGGDQFSLNFAGLTEDAETASVSVFVQDDEDGTYFATFQTETAGLYELSVLLDGVQIYPGVLEVAVLPSDVDPAKCSVDGTGLETPQPAGDGTINVRYLAPEIRVIARDSFGNVYNFNGLDIEVKSEGMDGLALSVQRTTRDLDFAEYVDCGFGCGEYRFLNPLTVAGRYSLGVNLLTLDDSGGIVTSNSLLRTNALDFTVSPASVFSANCEVSGGGAESCAADTVCTFLVQAKDAFGNVVEQRGDAFVVVLTHRADSLERISYTGIVTDMLDGNGRIVPGQYQASYQATRSGSYTLSVSRYGTNVKGSPRVVTILPGSPHPPSFSFEGFGSIGGVVSSQLALAVVARDEYGNVVSEPNMRRDMSASVQPPVEVTIRNPSNGRYSLSFVPQSLSLYTFNLTVYGLLIAQTLDIEVGNADTAVDFRFCSIDDLTSLSTSVATLASFEITPRAFGGSQVENQGSLYEVDIGSVKCPVCSAIPVSGVSTAGMVCCIDYNVDPPRVTYTSGTAGVFDMQVSLVRGDLFENPPIYGNPYNVAITPEATSASSSILQAQSDTGISQTSAGFPNQNIVWPRDVYGNDQVYLATASPSVMADLSGPRRVTTHVRDLSNGSFQLSYTMTIAGTYSLAVLIGDAPIRGSPFRVVVEGDSLFVPASTGSFSSWIAVGETSDGLELEGFAGESSVVSVQPRDAYGNAITTDVSFFSVNVSQGFPIVRTLAYSQRSGRYEVQHTLTASGYYSVRLFEALSTCAGAIDCVNVFGSPFTLQVQPSAINTANCRTYGPGTYFAVASVETQVNVFVRDTYGNNAILSSHAQHFAVTLTSRAVKVSDLYQFDLHGDRSIVVNGVGSSTTEDGVTLAYTALMPGRYELTVTFNGTVIGGTSASVCGLNKPCPVVDFENPPSPSRTQFADSGGRILVQFERSTNNANMSGRFDCSNILSEDTVSVLSELQGDSSCLFLNPSLLDISLGFGASIQVNDDLIWRPNSLRLKPVCLAGSAVCFAHSHAIEGASRVSRPENPVAPVAILKAPSSIGPCDEVVLDASSSYGSAGRQVRFFFGMQAGNSNDKQVRTAVFGQMQEPFDRSSISLPSSILKPGESYTFLVRVTNFLDASNIDSVTVVRRGDSGPLIFVEGPNTIAVRASQPFKLRASAALSQCHSGPSNKVLYSWSLVAINPSDELAQTVALHEQTKDTRTLYVPANSLLPGYTYTFKVTGAMDWNASEAGSSTVAVTCAYAPLIAKITGGNRAVWSAKSFELDATESIDLDGEAAVGDFTYEWSCMNNGGTECFADDHGILSSSTGILFVDSGLLVPGVYHFTVRVVKEPGPRSASSTVTMYIVPGSTDPLQIEPLSERKVNANERLVLNGLQSNASCDLMWYQLLGNDVLVYPDFVSTRLNLQSVALKPNVLLPGATYKFRLGTRCPSGLEGFGEINVIVNTAPSSGQFSVQPRMGYAALDTFSLLLKNWVDDAEDLPFTYEFRYATPAAPSEHIPLGTVDANWMDVHLPAPAAGQGDMHNVTLLASVIDNLRGKATSTATVSVLRLPSSNGTFIGNGRRLQDFSTSLLDQFVATGNVEGIIQMTISLASQEELECRTRETMISDLKDAAAKVVMNAGEVAGFAAALRSSMAGACIENITVGVRRLLSMSATTSALEVTQTLVGNSVSAGLDPTAEQGMGDTLSSSLGNIASKNTARRSLRSLIGHEQHPTFFRGRQRRSQDSRLRAASGSDDGQVLMDTLASLAASQLNGAVVGEDSKALSTESISMNVRQETSSALNGATLGAGAASFATPASMLQGAAPLSAQTANLAVSPFDSAERVGEVATLTLGVELSNLEEPVQLSVPVNFGVLSESATYFICVKGGDEARDGVTSNGLSACKEGCEGGVCIELPAPNCVGDLWTRCQYEDVDTCRFWNGEEWDGEGCIAQGLAGAVLQCECFHLTDFGGATSSAIPKMNFVDPTNPGAVFANLSADKILVIVIVCVMLLSYFALCYWGWRQDQRDNEQFAATNPASKYEVGKAETSSDDAVFEGNNYHLLKRAMQGKLTRSILLVKNRAVKLFRTEHKLFGAFWAKRSYYTRPRRFTVLFCMIIGNMFVSALFVGQEGTTFVQKIVAGIFSGLLMLPATVFFKKVFMTLSVDPETKARWDAEATAKAKAKQAALATSLTAGPTDAGVSAPPSNLRPDGYRQGLARGHIPHPDKDRMGVAQGPRPGFIGQFKRKLRVGNSGAPAPSTPIPPPLPPQQENSENGGSVNGGDVDSSQLSSMEAVGGYIPRRALPLNSRAHAPAPMMVENRSQASSPEYGLPFGVEEDTAVVGERQEMMLEHEVHTKKESRELTGRAKFEASLAKAMVNRLVKPSMTSTKEAKTVRIHWRFQYAAYGLAFVWYMLCCYFCILYGVSFSREIEQAWLIAFFISILQDVFVQESFLVSAKMSAQMIVLPNLAAWIAGKIADRYE